MQSMQCSAEKSYTWRPVQRGSRIVRFPIGESPTHLLSQSQAGTLSSLEAPGLPSGQLGSVSTGEDVAKLPRMKSLGFATERVSKLFWCGEHTSSRKRWSILELTVRRDWTKLLVPSRYNPDNIPGPLQVKKCRVLICDPVLIRSLNTVRGLKSHIQPIWDLRVLGYSVVCSG